MQHILPYRLFESSFTDSITKSADPLTSNAEILAIAKQYSSLSRKQVDDDAEQWSKILDKLFKRPLSADVIDLLTSQDRLMSDLRAVQHLSAPASALDRIARRNQGRGNNLCSAVAGHRNTAASTLEFLVKEVRGDDVREAAAKNPNLPVELQKELIQDKRPKTREALARNPGLATEIADLLTRDQDYFVRITVMANPNLSAAAIDQAMKNPDAEMRRFLAMNPELNPDRLVQLAKDHSERVRQRVAGNPKTPSSSLDLLTKDRDPSVRAQVAQNPTASKMALAVLAEDPDRHVADFALANPNFPKDYKGDLTGFALGAEDEDSWL